MWLISEQMRQMQLQQQYLYQLSGMNPNMNINPITTTAGLSTTGLKSNINYLNPNE